MKVLTKGFLFRLLLKCNFQCAIYLKTRINIRLLIIRNPFHSNLFSDPLNFELLYYDHTRYSENLFLNNPFLA